MVTKFLRQLNCSEDEIWNLKRKRFTNNVSLVTKREQTSNVYSSKKYSLYVAFTLFGLGQYY